MNGDVAKQYIGYLEIIYLEQVCEQWAVSDIVILLCGYIKIIIDIAH